MGANIDLAYLDDILKAEEYLDIVASVLRERGVGIATEEQLLIIKRTTNPPQK